VVVESLPAVPKVVAIVVPAEFLKIIPTAVERGVTALLNSAVAENSVDGVTVKAVAVVVVATMSPDAVAVKASDAAPSEA
jgi:hypothetical protein